MGGNNNNNGNGNDQNGENPKSNINIQNVFPGVQNLSVSVVSIPLTAESITNINDLTPYIVAGGSTTVPGNRLAEITLYQSGGAIFSHTGTFSVVIASETTKGLSMYANNLLFSNGATKFDWSLLNHVVQIFDNTINFVTINQNSIPILETFLENSPDNSISEPYGILMNGMDNVFGFDLKDKYVSLILPYAKSVSGFTSTTLVSVIMPEVERVGVISEGSVFGGFSGNSSLSLLYMPNVEKIGAISGTSLTALVLPKLNEIGRSAFVNNGNLFLIDMGESVNTIWHETFQECTSLQHIILRSTTRVIVPGNNNGSFNYSDLPAGSTLWVPEVLVAEYEQYWNIGMFHLNIRSLGEFPL
jgi:hypothetical protein